MKDLTGNTIICRLADPSGTDVFFDIMHFSILTYQNGKLSTDVIVVISFYINFNEISVDRVFE